MDNEQFFIRCSVKLIPQWNDECLYLVFSLKYPSTEKLTSYQIDFRTPAKHSIYVNWWPLDESHIIYLRL